MLNLSKKCRSGNSSKSISLSISDSTIAFAQKTPRHSRQDIEHFKPAF